MDNLTLSSRNCFARQSIERASHLRRNDEWIAEKMADANARFVPVWQTKNLIADEEAPQAVFLKSSDSADLIKTADSITFLGKHNGKTYFAVGFDAADPSLLTALNRLGQFKDLRGVGGMLDDLQGSLLAYSRAIAYWHSCNRFCGNCGSPTKSSICGHIRVCTNPDCGREHFPRTDPAIIVIVASGRHCLLGRQPRWRKNVYSTLAGFVEPGESIESAVAREVMEETGIQVNGVRYHSSQPWPFPCSIMLGFIAEAERTEVSLDGAELEDARWFSRKEMQTAIKEKTLILPGRVSIAYRLIEHWFDAHSKIRLKKLIDPG